MQLRNFVRRQKWRLRPLKRLVLPLRNLKRAVVAVLRQPPRIAGSTIDYAVASLIESRQVRPAENVSSIPHPFGASEPEATTSEAAFIFHLKNINFWARYGGSIVTSDNQLLSNLSPEVWGVENHPIFSRFRLPKSRPLHGRTAVAVTPEAPGNYYHWLIDLLPRLALIRAFAGGFDSFERILINGSHARYEDASLRALQLPLEKVRYVNERDRFQIDDAVIPSIDHYCKVIAPWKIEILRGLRDSLTPAPDPPRRRFYVSRKRAAVRRVWNEIELEDLLQDAGFATVELESQSWPEQVGIFANADIVFSPHGAALANTVFCRPGTLVAEISTRAGYRDFYLRLAASSGLRYRVIEARPRGPTEKSSFRASENEDMILDRHALQDFLNSL